MERSRVCALLLTSSGVLTRRQSTECAVRALVIVIVPPLTDHGLGVCQRHEGVDVETLVPKPAVEALDQGVLDGLSGPDEVDLYAALVGPLVEGL